MPRPRPKPLVTDSPPLLLPNLEPKLLHISNRLHHKPQRKNHTPRNIPRSAEIRLRKFRDVGTIQDRDGQGDRPDPNHLEDPEAEEGEEFVPFVVEAVVFAGFEDAEEQEGAEAKAPKHYEEGVHDLASMVVAAEGEG